MSSDSTQRPNSDLTPAERELGMDADITRRDFLNAVALGTGAALLGTPAPRTGSPGSRRRPSRRRTRRAMASVDRLLRGRRLRALERQHLGCGQCGARAPRRHVRDKHG